MPRAKSHSPDGLAAAAMDVFWRRGYEATSMEDLVAATGVSRHGIYGDFGGKHDLFLAGFEIYDREIVTPAFGSVEAPGADLDTVAAYFEHQIALAEHIGLPGPGCLVANTATEVAPHDAAALEKVHAHHGRLHGGFRNALANEAGEGSDVDLGSLVEALVIFAQGLWSASRVTDDAEALRRAVRAHLQTLKERLNG